MTQPTEINGKAIDMRDIRPITVGDWRELQRRGTTLSALQTGDIEHLARFAVYAARKANTTIEAADVNALSLGELSAFVQACILVESEAPAAPDPSLT